MVEWVLSGWLAELERPAEDSAAILRLENGEGPVRVRMVYCGEALVDEVVSSLEEWHEASLRLMEEMSPMGDEALAELEAMDPDSIAAAWAAQWEAMSPAERKEYSAEMERLIPMLDAALDDEPDLEALEETLETLEAEYPFAADLECEQWRKMRAEFLKKAVEKGKTGI